MIFLSHTNHTAVDKTGLLVIVLASYDTPLSHQPHRCICIIKPVNESYMNPKNSADYWQVDVATDWGG